MPLRRIDGLCDASQRSDADLNVKDAVSGSWAVSCLLVFYDDRELGTTCGHQPPQQVGNTAFQSFPLLN